MTGKGEFEEREEMLSWISGKCSGSVTLRKNHRRGLVAGGGAGGSHFLISQLYILSTPYCVISVLFSVSQPLILTLSEKSNTLF